MLESSFAASVMEWSPRPEQSASHVLAFGRALARSSACRARVASCCLIVSAASSTAAAGGVGAGAADRGQDLAVDPALEALDLGADDGILDAGGLALAEAAVEPGFGDVADSLLSAGGTRCRVPLFGPRDVLQQAGRVAHAEGVGEPGG